MDRVDEGGGSEDEVLREEFHLLQAGGGGGGGGGGTGAGVERVRLGAVRKSVLLQLQVTSQGVDVVNHLVTRRGNVTETAEVRNDTDVFIFSNNAFKNLNMHFMFLEEHKYCMGPAVDMPGNNNPVHHRSYEVT